MTTPTTQREADDLNGGMHASIFVKVWGDAGGGDAGRIALANYAYELGKRAATDQPSAGQVDDYQLIAHLIGIIFFAGDFIAETANERQLEALLIKTGHRYRSWAEIDARASLTPTAPALRDVEELFSEYWDIAYREGQNGSNEAENANAVLSKLRALFVTPTAPQAASQQAGKAIAADGDEFKPGQWWLQELEGISMLAEPTADQVRAVAVARKFAATVFAPQAATTAACQPSTLTGQPDTAICQPAATTASTSTIKTWQERCDWWSERSSTKLMVEAMKAEIADLRAALARAPLPAQQVQAVDVARDAARLKQEIVDALHLYTTDMEADAWYGSKPGVPDTCYDDVADHVIASMSSDNKEPK